MVSVIYNKCIIQLFYLFPTDSPYDRHQSCIHKWWQIKIARYIIQYHNNSICFYYYCCYCDCYLLVMCVYQDKCLVLSLTKIGECQQSRQKIWVKRAHICWCWHAHALFDWMMHLSTMQTGKEFSIKHCFSNNCEMRQPKWYFQQCYHHTRYTQCPFGRNKVQWR